MVSILAAICALVVSAFLFLALACLGAIVAAWTFVAFTVLSGIAAMAFFMWSILISLLS